MMTMLGKGDGGRLYGRKSRHAQSSQYCRSRRPCVDGFLPQARLRDRETGRRREGPAVHINCGLENDFGLDLDTENFAQVWNKAWKGQPDLAGKVVVGFHVESRQR